MPGTYDKTGHVITRPKCTNMARRIDDNNVSAPCPHCSFAHVFPLPSGEQVSQPIVCHITKEKVIAIIPERSGTVEPETDEEKKPPRKPVKRRKAR